MYIPREQVVNKWIDKITDFLSIKGGSYIWAQLVPEHSRRRCPCYRHLSFMEELLINKGWKDTQAMNGSPKINFRRFPWTRNPSRTWVLAFTLSGMISYV
jgi:hypothetical protein